MANSDTPLKDVFLLAGNPPDQDGFYTGPHHGTKLMIVEGLCIAALNNGSKTDCVAEDMKWAMDTADCHSGIIVLPLKDGIYLHGDGPYRENFLGAVPDKYRDQGITCTVHHGPNGLEGLRRIVDKYKNLCEFGKECVRELEKLANRQP